MWCDRWHIHTYYKVISGCISLTCRITRLVFLTGDYEKVPKHPNYMPGMRRSARLRRQQRRRMALIWRRRMKLMKLVGVPESRWVSQASSQRTVWRRTRTCRLSEFFFNTMVNDSQYKNADAIALVYNIMACSYTHNFIRHQRQQKIKRRTSVCHLKTHIAYLNKNCPEINVRELTNFGLAMNDCNFGPRNVLKELLFCTLAVIPKYFIK